ncbi:MAG: hypothetical protein ACR2JW_13895 [Thermomicrobiales bacterium]
MKSGRVHRWFGAGLTGALFALMLAASAGSVAADGLVTPIPGQDPQAPIQYVASPGFFQNGTAQIPPGAATTLNGQAYYYYNGQYYYTNPGVPTGATLINGQYYFVNGQYYDVNGNPITGAPFGQYGGFCGFGCGVTAAGPIVGATNNGATLVYDPTTGDIDPYVIGANGFCAADASGHALKGTSCNP